MRLVALRTAIMDYFPDFLIEYHFLLEQYMECLMSSLIVYSTIRKTLHPTLPYNYICRNIPCWWLAHWTNTPPWWNCYLLLQQHSFIEPGHPTSGTLFKGGLGKGCVQVSSLMIQPRKISSQWHSILLFTSLPTLLLPKQWSSTPLCRSPVNHPLTSNIKKVHSVFLVGICMKHCQSWLSKAYVYLFFAIPVVAPNNRPTSLHTQPESELSSTISKNLHVNYLLVCYLLHCPIKRKPLRVNALLCLIFVPVCLEPKTRKSAMALPILMACA
jgi:hypothetical protein